MGQYQKRKMKSACWIFCMSAFPRSRPHAEKTYCPSKIKITHAEKSLLPNTVPPHMRKN